MPKFEIRVCKCNSRKSNNIEKFKNYCKEALPKKKGAIFQVTHNGAMIETGKKMIFQILNELDKHSIPVRTIKKAR